MTDKVGIFNQALIPLGTARLVMDPNESTKAAILCNAVYDDARDATLRAHPWNFAEEHAQLAAKTTPPLFGFQRCFALPTAPFCLRVLRIHDRPRAVWKVKGRDLQTDEAAPLDLIYVARVTDEQVFDPLFVAAFAARLGAMVAYGLTKSRTKENDAWERYRNILLPEARSVDGQEGSAPFAFGDSFLDSRR